MGPGADSPESAWQRTVPWQLNEPPWCLGPCEPAYGRCSSGPEGRDRCPLGHRARKGNGVVDCGDHACRYNSYLGESLKHQHLNLPLAGIMREVVITF